MLLADLAVALPHVRGTPIDMGFMYMGRFHTIAVTVCSAFYSIGAMGAWNGASLADPDTLPELNHKVVEFVQQNMKKRVGRGECWDLAAGALEFAGASWDGRYSFGRQFDPLKEEVLPGDIVQFENVVTSDRSGNVKRDERMPKHTAIIHKVHEKGVYTIAHQNTDVAGRNVGVSRFILGNVVRGKVMFYRPVKVSE